MAKNQLVRSHLEGYGMASNVSLNQETKKKIKAGAKIHTFAFGQSPFPVMEEAVKGLKEYAEENDYVPVQGYGSFSNVKLACSQTKQPGLVAIKIISRSKVPESYLDRFLPRELEFWPKLNHPNIVKCHETFEELQSVYIVLEYACNGDMMTYINNYGPLSEEKTKFVTKQVCNAVKYLHDKGITHRDLKLENLLLDKNSNIKVTDFGFVKNYTKWELSHTFCGTKSYAAPEILSAQPYDARKVDTWAIGAIVYIVCTGKMPFDESKTINKILEEQKQLSLIWNKEQKISRTCKDLIFYLFTYKYSNRPTMHEVLSNKWFKENPKSKYKSSI